MLSSEVGAHLSGDGVVQLGCVHALVDRLHPQRCEQLAGLCRVVAHLSGQGVGRLNLIRPDRCELALQSELECGPRFPAEIGRQRCAAIAVAAKRVAGAADATAAPLERRTDGDGEFSSCLLYTSPSPRDKRQSRMPSSA